MSEKKGLLPFIEYKDDGYTHVLHDNYFCGGEEILLKDEDKMGSVMREEDAFLFKSFRPLFSSLEVTKGLPEDSAERIFEEYKKDAFWLYGLLREAGTMPFATETVVEKVSEELSVNPGGKIMDLSIRLREEDNPGIGYFIQNSRPFPKENFLPAFTYLTLEERANELFEEKNVKNLSPRELKVRTEIINRKYDLVVENENYERAAMLQKKYPSVLPQPLL